PEHVRAGNRARHAQGVAPASGTRRPAVACLCTTRLLDRLISVAMGCWPRSYSTTMSRSPRPRSRPPARRRPGATTFLHELSETRSQAAPNPPLANTSMVGVHPAGIAGDRGWLGRHGGYFLGHLEARFLLIGN